MKKPISYLCILALLMGTFTGCSGSKTTNKSNEKQVELVFACWGDINEKKATDAMLVKFTEKNPDIKVKAMVIPSADYDTKMATMVAANQQLDLTQQESATIAYPLFEQGKIEPLNSFFDKDKTISQDSFVKSAFYKSGSDIIGIYQGIEVFTLYYSKKAFALAGIPEPPKDPAKAWSWDTFVNTAKKLTLDKNGKNAADSSFDSKNIKQYGVQMGKWWGSWGNFVYSNGGDYVTDDNKFGLSQPAGYEAIQKIADLSNVAKVSPTPVSEKGLPGIDVALATGQYAMGIDGQWQCLGLGNAKVDFGTAPLPIMKKPVSQSVSGMLAIMKNSKYKDQAWKLLKYINDPTDNITLYETGNLMPVLKDWNTKPDLLAKWTKNAAHPDGYKESVIATLQDYSVPSPTGVIKNFNKIMDIVNPALDKVWLGQTTAEQAMKSIEPKVTPLIQGKR